MAKVWFNGGMTKNLSTPISVTHEDSNMETVIEFTLTEGHVFWRLDGAEEWRADATHPGFDWTEETLRLSLQDQGFEFVEVED